MRHILLMTLGAIATFASPAALQSAESQVELAARLRREYGMVRSMQCILVTKMVPTQDTVIPDLRELIRVSRYHKDAPLEQMIWTSQIAAERSSVKRWFRKGSMERLDTLDAANAVTNSVAFDGQTLRSVPFQEKQKKVAAVHTAKSSGWDTMARKTPFTMQYLFVEKPFADIVAKATRFETKHVLRSGKALDEYTIDSPLNTTHTLVLRYDAGKLVEREFICSRMAIGPREVHELALFSKFQTFVDASGEAISFPTLAVYHFFVGQLPSGKLVENQGWEMQLKDIAFNTDLPDDLFTLAIPPNSKVYDGINRMGILEPGAPIPPAPPPRPSNWRYAYVIGAVVLASALVILVRLRQRRIAT